ncbi:hypothetical protein NR756_01500 [Alloalcanivorax xenomutans]|uniref:hypothetical protein n=1 Tax=Alloalcanivorax xenomutans TaxID=1094342 RepID=UPI003A7F86B7
MKEAIIGLVGVALGALITASTGFLQAYHFDSLNIEREIVKERVKLIEEASSIFALNGKVMAHYGTASIQSGVLHKASAVCANQLMQGKKIDCDFDDIENQIVESSEEVFKAYERFAALKAKSNVYFCGSTNQRINTLANGGAWWIPERESDRSAVLEAMYNELTCANKALQRTSR